MLVDSHCHLEYEGLVDDQPAVLARARQAGVGAFLNISTKRGEWDQVIATAEREEDVFASIGIHPHHADDHQDVTETELAAAAAHPRVIGLGETGLDYYYDHSGRSAQQRLFRRHIAVSRQLQMPVIIHTRNAEDDTAAILSEEMGQGTFPALIHCFTATERFGQRVLDLGLSISISGIVTFKNARDLATFTAKIPENRLLVETDSPFLAPVPHRGRPCEPAFVADTARYVAKLRGVTPETLAETTTANFRRLFARAST